VNEHVAAELLVTKTEARRDKDVEKNEMPSVLIPNA